MKKTLQEIAEYVGGRIVGDASIVISGLDNIEGAGERDLTFAVDPHIEEAKTCRAAAVMLPEGVADFPKTAGAARSLCAPPRALHAEAPVPRGRQ